MQNENKILINNYGMTGETHCYTFVSRYKMKKTLSEFYNLGSSMFKAQFMCSVQYIYFFCKATFMLPILFLFGFHVLRRQYM